MQITHVLELLKPTNFKAELNRAKHTRGTKK